MNKRINIILPEKTVNVLDRVTTKGARSRFIDRAILRYVETEGKEALRNQLIAGYSANAERDLEAAIAWFAMEEEAAEDAESSGAEMPIKRL
jgi:CopG family transcriptional regulator/antitoxin EndoAI